MSPSVLVSLPPINNNKPNKESNSSYISRLAMVYRVPVWYLIKTLVQPKLTREYLRDKKTLEVVGSKSRSINGVSGWASEITTVFQELTSRQDLNNLTLLFWKDVLPVRGLLFKTKRWCPSCFEDMKKEKNIIYEPLLWSIEPVQICPVHRTKLISICPCCSHSQFVLERYSYPGYCSFCGHWFGTSKLNTEKETPPDENQINLCSQVGELLAHSTNIKMNPDKSNVNEFIRKLVDISTGGSTWEFAKIFGYNHKTIVNWCLGEQIPELKNLHYLCSFARVTMLDVFINSNIRLNPVSVDTIIQEQIIKKPRKNNFDKMEKALNEAVESNECPPLPVKQVARKLDCDEGFLKKKFPVQCDLLSKRYKSFLRQKKEELKQKIRQDVISAIEMMIKGGIYPSIHETGKRIHKPGLMRCKDAINAYYETLQKYSLMG
jgi:hypothetical protein